MAEENAGNADIKARRKKRHGRETIEAIVIALVLALIIRTFVIQAFKIPSGSMEDTLLVGDHLIVNKFSYGLQVPRPAMIRVLGIPVPFFETTLVRTWGEIERGDVIVFRYPADRHKDYIKRVIGLPGDTVELKNRVVYVNGKPIDDAHAVHKGTPYGTTPERSIRFGPIKVPEGELFMMGDNRDRSSDSRYWGTVPIRDIKGKAFLIYWSREKNGDGMRLSRIGDRIH